MPNETRHHRSLFAAVAGGIHILPVLHERFESSMLVRLAFEVLEPDAVAVEVPSSLESAYLRAIERLPAISVLLFDTARGDTIYLPIHPADAMAEAARTALERSLPLVCADLDVDGYADHRDPLPDGYTLLRLGPRSVHEALRRSPRERDAEDDRREAAMAFHAQRLAARGCRRVLLVCGMHHVEGLERSLGITQAAPLTPPRRSNVRLVHPHPESLGEVLAEIPFYAAAYEAWRHPEDAALPLVAETSAPPRAAGRTHGPFRVLIGGKGDDPARIERAVARASRRASLAQWPRWAAAPTAVAPLDRVRMQWALLREAEAALEDADPGERVQPWQRANLARFSRNLAVLSGGLVADLYDLIVAARGCVSEDFAWELYHLATSYPRQAERAEDLPTARIRAEEMFDGIRRLRLVRRRRRPKHRGIEGLLRGRRRNEQWAGEWLDGFDGSMVCSFPPEDLVIEEFGRYLRHRGKSILSEEQARTVPFTTSVLDGIDLRETIRHWSERTLYVRELGRAPGNVGAVVVVFDDDTSENERFPYHLTWLGEHAQESDMAFYATDPTQGIVGPGICRVLYGGFFMSYPPGRLRDVWTDPDYRFAESKPEVLLLAAIEYSCERVIVHAAPKPPRSIFHTIAARLDRKIVHVPLGTISPSTVRRIRVMHLLSGHDKRGIAKEYVR